MASGLLDIGRDMAGRIKARLYIAGKHEHEFSLSSAWLNEIGPLVSDEEGLLSYLKRPHTGDYCVIPLKIDCSSYILLERRTDDRSTPW